MRRYPNNDLITIEKARGLCQRRCHVIQAGVRLNEPLLLNPMTLVEAEA